MTHDAGTQGTRIPSSVKYIAWSAVSFSLNVGFNVLLVAFGLSKNVAFVVTTLMLFTINFTASRYWIFADSKLTLKEQFKRFTLSTAVFRLAEILVFILINSMIEVDHKLLIIAILVVSFVAKYVVQRALVFGDN